MQVPPPTGPRTLLPESDITAKVVSLRYNEPNTVFQSVAQGTRNISALCGETEN